MRLSLRDSLIILWHTSLMNPFHLLQVIPIINIPGFGDKAAEKVCTDMKIQSQNDREKLEEAKKQVYLKGFTDGVLTVGPHAGKKVGVYSSTPYDAYWYRAWCCWTPLWER